MTIDKDSAILYHDGSKGWWIQIGDACFCLFDCGGQKVQTKIKTRLTDCMWVSDKAAYIDLHALLKEVT